MSPTTYPFCGKHKWVCFAGIQWKGYMVNYEKSHCAKLCRWRREHKRNYFGFLSFMRLHGITILVSGFMVVDTITGILRIPGRESKLLHVLHNGELLGTYSSDVQHFWDKTRCNVDWEDKISSFEHWTVKKPRIGGVELYLFAPFGLVGCHLVCHQIPFQHWGINI